MNSDPDGMLSYRAWLSWPFSVLLESHPSDKQQLSTLHLSMGNIFFLNLTPNSLNNFFFFFKQLFSQSVLSFSGNK